MSGSSIRLRISCQAITETLSRAGDMRNRSHRLESPFLHDLSICLARDKNSGRVGLLRRLNTILDPPVEHLGRLKSMAARRKEYRGIETGGLFFLEFHEAVGSVNSD